MNPKDKPWTPADERTLTRTFVEGRSFDEIAEILGRTPRAVCCRTYKMGLKRGPHRANWTPQKLDYLKRLFPTMFNYDLVKILGISLRTIERKARELGIEKEPGFLDKNRAEISRRASKALREKYRREEMKSGFKKGERSCIEGEFKPGHVESPETKAKRSASLKRYWARRKLEERVKKHYGV